MLKNSLLIAISLVLFSCNTSSQTKYKVTSIDTLAGIKHYRIKVQEGEKQLTIISAFSLENLSPENSVVITPGIQLNVTLKEVSEKNNPFIIPNNRSSSRGYYVDGKLFYDPKIPLYYSACIIGLSYLTNCK